MNAYQCDRCGKLVKGKPSSRIATFSDELGGDEWALALHAIIMGQDDKDEPELCHDCRMALVDKALREARQIGIEEV